MNPKQLILQNLKKLHILSKTDFVILFGSVSQGTNNALSDIDICVSLNLPSKERFKARMMLSGLAPDKYDIQIFEDLPLYIQKSVLSGKVLYCKKQEKMIEKAIQIINQYDDFKKIYDYYLAQDKTKVEI